MAAPYAAAFGFARSALTLAMFTIEPPSACPCITAFARCEHTIGASRLRSMIARENFGDTVAESAGGAPPALLTSTSRDPTRSTVVGDQRVDGVRVADVGGDEQRGVAVGARQLLGLVPAADHHLRTGRGGTSRRSPGRSRGRHR